MKRIALIPIDNRPVCYTLPKNIAEIDENLLLLLPDRKFLGGLYEKADDIEIQKWLSSVETDIIIVSLDTIAYGGLVSSRRCNESFDDIKIKMDNLKEILKSKKAKVYAFSSIMRISNNNVSEEEKEYWSDYGKKIFEFSYNLHKNCQTDTDIPPEIIEDYLKTRERNFEINKMYLDWLDEGIFEMLVFSKDDCAEFGLNVKEAQELEKIILEKKLQACVKTGADEIPLTLFACGLCELNKKAPKISVKFLAPKYKDLISKYEDISIEKSVLSQLSLAGIEVVNEKNADVILLVNNFEEEQGEIVMNIETKSFDEDLDLPSIPYIIADVRFANGADNKFIQKFLAKTDLKTFWGYSAWNTSANTLGSLISGCMVRFLATKYNENAFKKLQLIRFLDDWAYQANVRQELKKQNQLSADILKKLMNPFEQKLFEIFEMNLNIEYNFPWHRFFEVEIKIK